MRFHRILVTGAAGKVARSVRPQLSAMCDELRLTDTIPFEASGPNLTTAVGYCPRSARIDARAPARPDGRYGAT